MSVRMPASWGAEPPAGFDLAPVLRAAWRARVRIALATVTAALVTLGILFLVPKWYRSTAVILPPEESDLLANLSVAQRALSKFPAFGVLPDFFTPADIYKAILLSRSAQESVAREFDLVQVYRKKGMEKTLKELRTHYRVKLNPDGTIAVEVDDKDPRRAAGMANAFLAALDRLNVQTRNSTAHRNRLFLEQRVSETDSLLRASEAALQAYSVEHRAIAPIGTSSGGSQAAADLMARKMLLEVRLGTLRGYLRDDHEQVVQTRAELEQLNRRVADLPALQTGIVRLAREAKIYEQLYLLLTAELEQARIRETMDTPTVQILDPAIPPERHVRPRKLILSLMAGALALVASVAWYGLRDRGDSEATA
jgi:tyrosine-protein kinase Etk/Wzc